MAVYNLGSINIDHIFRLSHLPKAGETLQANHYACGLGGKGANQSLALAMAGAQVHHIGRMAANDLHFIDPLKHAGVEMSHILDDALASGLAIVMVDETSGENQIILNPGGNHQIGTDQIDRALAQARPGDWALTQNETNNVAYYLRQAKAQGLKVCYSAAPFVAATTVDLLPLADLLVVNEVEAQALASALGCMVENIPVPHLLITLGASGARYIGQEGAWQLPSPKVEAVDTTGAGDTFLGFLLAALTQNQNIQAAMHLALNAAALQVTRPGTAAAIPTLDEVKRFIAAHN
ncbi:MAG TPA: ribokinase [Marinobacterium sp.]|nr:ribokinase [Marinobacterium sp.]